MWILRTTIRGNGPSFMRTGSPAIDANVNRYAQAPLLRRIWVWYVHNDAGFQERFVCCPQLQRRNSTQTTSPDVKYFHPTVPGCDLTRNITMSLGENNRDFPHKHIRIYQLGKKGQVKSRRAFIWDWWIKLSLSEEALILSSTWTFKSSYALSKTLMLTSQIISVIVNCPRQIVNFMDWDRDYTKWLLLGPRENRHMFCSSGNWELLWQRNDFQISDNAFEYKCTE